MKRAAVVLGSALALLSGTLRADDPQTFYGIWNGNSFSWTNSAGESVSWAAGSIAWFTEMSNQNSMNWSTLTAYGIVVDVPARKRFWSDGERVTVGAGGISFTQDGVFSMGRAAYGDSNERLYLSADQTWRGPDSGAYANIAVGYMGYGNYWMMPLKVGADVHSLTIAGNLNAWITSPSNNLSGVDVLVESPARLYLPLEYYVSSPSSILCQCDAHLRARKLTLDGAALQVGGSATHYYVGSARLVSDLDASHFASELVLTNGAGVTAGAASTFAIPTVRAGGAEAVNSISGPFRVTQSATAVSLYEGTTLSFGDQLTVDAADASLTAEGSGLLRLPASADFLGGIELGDEVSITFTGGGNIVSPIVGGKEVFSDAPGRTNILFAAALAGFSGSRISVSRGSLMLMGERPQGVEIVVAEGAELLESNGMIVTDVARAEEEIVVSSNQTLLVYGNGLTAATTVVLDGGTMLFRLPATVSSPVNVRQRSDIATDSLSVTGTVAGAVDCAITNQTYGLHVIGDGCVKFAGGATFAGAPPAKTTYDTFYVDQGSVLLTNGKYKFGWGGFAVWDAGLNDGKWGRYLGVMDGGEVTFADQGSAAGTARPVIMVYPKADGAYYSNSAMVEIGVGGSITLPWHSQVILGNNQNRGRFVVNGGSFLLNGNSHMFYLTGSGGGYITGYLEMRAGLFELSRPLVRGRFNGQGRIIWSGGTIRPTANFATGMGDSLYGVPASGYTAGDPLRTWVQIAGDDCVLDLSNFPRDVFNAVPTPGCDRSEWFGTGTLTVKGGKTFRMTSFPAGVSLRAEGDGTVIEVPADAKVFDNDKCVANMNAKPYPTNIYSSDGAEISGALPVNVFAVTNGAAAFTNLLADAVTAVASVEVCAGGVWDNETTIAGEDVSITNMAFREGAVLRARVNDGKAQTLGIEGVLTLPSSAVFNAVKDVSLPASSPVVISAGGGIVGKAQWSGSRSLSLRVDGDDLVLAPMGLVFIVK